MRKSRATRHARQRRKLIVCQEVFDKAQERLAPVLEEFPRPGFPVVVPKLAKGLLQHVSGIEPLVGGQQDLEVRCPILLRADEVID
jgi:hypothetical protein